MNCTISLCGNMGQFQYAKTKKNKNKSSRQGVMSNCQKQDK